MKHFEHKTAAERYAKARPYHHDVVVERIRRYLKLQGRMKRALDIGCGTGLSSVALKAIANHIDAVDSSIEMLSHTPKDSRITYVNARAEALPFRDETFKLAVVSSAFHWFDRERSIPEARRVLTARGWLVVYNNAFQARMRENAGFWKAFRDTYPKRYPAPIREWRPVDAELAARHGFELRHEEKYTNEVVFTPEGLVDYLSTQSNVIAAVEGGGESIEGVRGWLFGLVKPFFAGESGTFEFGGKITFLRKTVE